MISAVERLHELNILHRDIKSSNILLSTKSIYMETDDFDLNQSDQERGSHKATGNIKLLLCDFSSAVTSKIIEEGFYDYSNGPQINGQITIEYAPPEVILSQDSESSLGIPFNSENPLAYDM